MPRGRRPGLRAAVLSVSAMLVLGTAVAVALTVSDHLEQATMNEAVRTTEALVQGFMDPVATETALSAPAGPQGAALNVQLGRLVATGKILRIKVWAPNGTIVFSDLAALRGVRFGVDGDLGAALRGDVATDLSDASDPENVFERGLAQRFLSVYLPVRASAGGPVLGAYEIYEDAAPIQADIATTREDVLVIVGAMALALLALLVAAFSGASRLLARQNRRLREQAATEQVLMTDLRRSEERFRSLVQNSADVDLVLSEDGTIAYESPAIERILGYQEDDRLGRSPLEIIHPADRTWSRN